MTDRRKVRLVVKLWIIVIAAAIVIGYGAFQAKNFAEGPDITIVSPRNGETVTDALVSIQGTVKNISFLTLNGNKIFTNEAGAFDEKILLSNGYNVVTLTAEDRFGRTITKTLQIIKD